MRIATKDKILNTAERLFAERGFTDTSLRLITSHADVNLASVNYHFGSKKELIQAVLRRYLDAFMPLVDEAMQVHLDSAEAPNLNQVFASFAKPLLEMNRIQQHGTAMFLLLLGRGYTDEQGHLRRYITQNFGQTIDKFRQVVSRAYPELSPVDMFWRLHFTLGTVIFTMASSAALRDIAASDYGEKVNIESLIYKVLPYLCAGVGAPIGPLTLD
ncbi:TetR/AcrR family transcriptional regulator [Alginatibacterium sediminis]|uniref:TetR/AcrR family transcriptional regulator n=1 Tax=Alginatibacterium sediminis TaxID=2164068 RepID=A0A420EHU4_9ALTE|nr:TetR/AcrR family transcriptional regulator [Alginatibacterium sediminis]RKF20224.1 TetR/AcrR family transcriptional regulator [Alginatibacterium sediminis]